MTLVWLVLVWRSPVDVAAMRRRSRVLVTCGATAVLASVLAIFELPITPLGCGVAACLAAGFVVQLLLLAGKRMT